MIRGFPHGMVVAGTGPATIRYQVQQQYTTNSVLIVLQQNREELEALKGGWSWCRHPDIPFGYRTYLPGGRRARTLCDAA